MCNKIILVFHFINHLSLVQGSDFLVIPLNFFKIYLYLFVIKLEQYETT